MLQDRGEFSNKGKQKFDDERIRIKGRWESHDQSQFHD
jgi:hypothetical protein